MPQSLSQVAIHLVYSTKNRTPWLTDELRPELYAVLNAVLRGDGHTAINANGYHDHVHLLFGLARTESISEVVSATKVASTKWLKGKHASLSDFGWQHGYGAFAVSHSLLPMISDYVDGQVEHHSVTSFQDEFRKLCVENGIPFDERYVWD
ncbi:MAG TPA: IS200/IS605 family transposase [Fimbriimonas sp.]|nr:IS200/IS605 family transposase [Fimbriimonas sp.]